MAKNDEKTLRQLSLLSFLLAAGRPVTAREVRESVEGYAGMTDQAFKKRFFDDREDLKAVGLTVQRMTDPRLIEDEAYYLSGDDYRLPDVQLTAEEYSALVSALLLLQERFPYETPLRLALAAIGEAQGHYAHDDAPSFGQHSPTSTPTGGGTSTGSGTPTGIGIIIEDSADIRRRLQRLEQALAAGKTVHFDYEGAQPSEVRGRTVDPYGVFLIHGHWYIVGRDHLRDAVRMFRVDRIRGKIAYPTKKARDFTIPPDWDPREYRARPPWLLGDPVGTADISVDARLAWWVSRTYARHLETPPPTQQASDADGPSLFTLPYSDPDPLLAWVITWRRHVRLLGPPELVERLRSGIAAAVRLHEERTS